MNSRLKVAVVAVAVCSVVNAFRPRAPCTALRSMTNNKGHPLRAAAPSTTATTTTTTTTEAVAARKSTWTTLLRLLLPGEGQSFGDRLALQARGAKRGPLDPQMWTHGFFLIPTILALKNNLVDLFILLAVTTPLSLMYHHTYERPGLLTQLEGVAAKLLFLYGVGQLFYAPSAAALAAEVFFFVCTVAVFLITNLQKQWYDPYHCWLHVFPALWAAVVAATHKPLFF